MYFACIAIENRSKIGKIIVENEAMLTKVRLQVKERKKRVDGEAENNKKKTKFPHCFYITHINVYVCMKLNIFVYFLIEIFFYSIDFSSGNCGFA